MDDPGTWMIIFHKLIVLLVWFLFREEHEVRRHKQQLERLEQQSNEPYKTSKPS